MVLNQVVLAGIVSNLSVEEKTFNIEYVKCVYNNIHELKDGDKIGINGRLKDGYVEVIRIIGGGVNID